MSRDSTLDSRVMFQGKGLSFESRLSTYTVLLPGTVPKNGMSAGCCNENYDKFTRTKLKSFLVCKETVLSGLKPLKIPACIITN